MKNLRLERLQILILAAPFAAAALLWNKLPAQMAIHWGINGRPDQYAGRTMASLFLPCLNLFFAALVAFLPRLDPRFARYDDETRASLRHTFKAMRLAITLFLAALALAIIVTPLCPAIQVPAVGFAGAGLLFIILGNLLTKLRPNWFFGIRTPWTLESREVWTRTHRLGGKVMMGVGAVVVIFGFVLPPKLFFFYVLLPAIGLMAVIPIAYSYFIARGRKKTGEIHPPMRD